MYNFECHLLCVCDVNSDAIAMATNHNKWNSATFIAIVRRISTSTTTTSFSSFYNGSG